jgi:uncharacterized protein YdhG (YjbR/CyaY superfamily)
MRPAEVPESVDAYLALVPEHLRAGLENLRAAIRASVPDATEVIYYRVPTFFLTDASRPVNLVGFAAAATYCSFYVMSPALVRELADELTDYDVHGSTIRFRPESPLPAAIVDRVVQARVAENRARRAGKASTTKR